MYLVLRLRWPLARAWQHVSQCRPQMAPHEDFVTQLQAMECTAFPELTASTLTADITGPSLQQQLRDIRAEVVAAGGNGSSSGGGGAGGGAGAAGDEGDSTSDTEVGSGGLDSDSTAVCANTRARGGDEECG